MSGTVHFLRAVRADVFDARDWYERQVTGLGADFTKALETTLARIAATPEHFAEARPGVRKAKLSRFPYSVFFEHGADGVLVIAVFHARRDPLVWRGRMRS